MGLETGTYISDLNANNPVNDTDIVGEGDDHIRLLKSTILNTFPNISGAMTLTHQQLNAAAIKGEANNFTEPQRISGAAPWLRLSETDEAVDEKEWRISAIGSILAIGALDDAFAVEDIGLRFLRTAGTIETAEFFADVFMRAGESLRFYDITDTDQVEFRHDGVNFQINDITGTALLRVRNMGLQVEDGQALRVQDATDADYWQTTHSGNSVLHDYVNTADVHHGFNNAITGYYYFNGAGGESRIYLRRQGADQGWWRASGSSLEFRSLGHGNPLTLVAEDAGGTARTMLFADPDAGLSMYWAGVVSLRTIDADATGNTTGAEILDHDGDWRDVGMNILAQFNNDESDTLEARHCGRYNIRDGGANKTLTLEASTSNDFPNGGVTTIYNAGSTGSYFVAEGTGTTLYVLEPGIGETAVSGGQATIGPGGYGYLHRRNDTDYWLIGANITPS